jgi:hypothetical protein
MSAMSFVAGARTHAMHLLAVLLVAGAVISAGCGGVTDPSSNTVESFSGSLSPGGVATHTFSAGKNGEVQLKLTAIAPNPASLIGWALGLPVNSLCSAFTSITTAGLNTAAVTYPVNKGSYCVQVYEAGTSTVTQTYTIQVSHP